MANDKALGLIFSNTCDEQLRELTAARAAGSIPFVGRYRLIDFPLSNMVHAGITKVGVLTKNNYQSLMDHIGSGKAWDLSRKNEGLYILSPYGVLDAQYAGRVASLAGIASFLRGSTEDYVVMSDCHVVGNIDYDRLIEAHIASGADVTIAYQTGEALELPDNLVLGLNKQGRVTELLLGSRPAGSCHYGIGLYVVGRDWLLEMVADAKSRNRMHFERDILQQHVDDRVICGYEVPEYTMAITSLGRYYQANMAALDPAVRERLFLPARPIYTKVRDRCPAIYGLSADASESLVADGSRIDGTVRHSILFRDVRVEKGAVVENCVVMQGSVIGAGARISGVVLDKNVTVQENRILQGAASYPIFVAKGSTI